MHRTIAIKSQQLILNVNQLKWRKKKVYFALFLIKTLNIDRTESTSCSYKNKRDFFQK